ncbi:DUF3473 domain-containing protein [Bacteroidetes/Chlorobi group bacterium Naka2016]|nr:MAG: DUF3473 domain-containing protein [Bacteroidetes/Chlorobi group bacterium Naka2016]
MSNVFSIDVEDWYHIFNIPSAPKREDWDKVPSIVEYNFLKLLDILDSQSSKSTCFFLGYVGKRFPRIVIEANRRGHEVASHGFYHQPVNQMSPKEFYEDLVNSKKLLEDISGSVVLGFRAPSFTVTNENPWFFEVLADAGYKYDSSVFPAFRFSLGGMKKGNLAPYEIILPNGIIIEFPITVAKFLGLRFCFTGGGYLRLFPYPLIKFFKKKVENENRPLVFYIHPREIDPMHPRLKANFIKKFMSYYNIKSTEEKIVNLTRETKFGTFRDLLSNYLQKNGR